MESVKGVKGQLKMGREIYNARHETDNWKSALESYRENVLNPNTGPK